MSKFILLHYNQSINLFLQNEGYYIAKRNNKNLFKFQGVFSGRFVNGVVSKIFMERNSTCKLLTSTKDKFSCVYKEILVKTCEGSYDNAASIRMHCYVT